MKKKQDNSWKRTGLDQRPTIPYVRVYTPKKGKGAKNDRQAVKAMLQKEARA